jgi:DNA-binding IscR family transcriptional regulator
MLIKGGKNMDLTDREKKIVDALKMLGATAQDKLKTADDVARKAVLPKNLVANDLMMLANKKVVKRVVREKAAGYFLLQQI